jgi:hypothetical protein
VPNQGSVLTFCNCVIVEVQSSPYLVLANYAALKSNSCRGAACTVCAEETKDARTKNVGFKYFIYLRLSEDNFFGHQIFLNVVSMWVCGHT